jgi:hypothetical protein
VFKYCPTKTPGNIDYHYPWKIIVMKPLLILAGLYNVLYHSVQHYQGQLVLMDDYVLVFLFEFIFAGIDISPTCHKYIKHK